MKTIYIKYDTDFYVNQYSNNDTELETAFMEDDFNIIFGFTRVKEEDGKLILYNDIQVKSQYYVDKELEKAKQEILNQIELYKQELLATDYIVTKIAEAQALGEDITELLNKYSETIANRKNIRTKINELEEKLNKEDKWRTILN